MIVFALAMLLQAATPGHASAADCMGTLVTFGNGDTRTLVSFWVSGASEQLAHISEAAQSIGAITQPPKLVDGQLVLFVFFENSVSGFKALKLVNDVYAGIYHPGVPKSEIKKDVLLLPSSTLRNCKK